MANNDTKIETKDQKTYFFTKEELDVLRPRQNSLNQFEMIANDLKNLINAFIFGNVFQRLSVDPNKYNAEYDLNKGTLVIKATEKKDIVVPNKKIILPS
jgi:hypothetical protein